MFLFTVFPWQRYTVRIESLWMFWINSSWRHCFRWSDSLNTSFYLWWPKFGSPLRISVKNHLVIVRVKHLSAIFVVFPGWLGFYWHVAVWRSCVCLLVGPLVSIQAGRRPSAVETSLSTPPPPPPSPAHLHSSSPYWVFSNWAWSHMMMMINW